MFCKSITTLFQACKHQTHICTLHTLAKVSCDDTEVPVKLYSPILVLCMTEASNTALISPNNLPLIPSKHIILKEDSLLYLINAKIVFHLIQYHLLW